MNVVFVVLKTGNRFEPAQGANKQKSCEHTSMVLVRLEPTFPVFNNIRLRLREHYELPLDHAFKKILVLDHYARM
jgi:hypothetical protein